MKPRSNRDIQNRLKQAAGQEVPPMWERIEAGIRDSRYSFEAAEEKAVQKAWWSRPAVAVAASLFLVLAAGLTMLYPILMPPANPTPAGAVDLSFKVRAEVLGTAEYGLEGNRSESLRLIESYTELNETLARIGLLLDEDTRVSTKDVPYPQKVEAELPYDEAYFKKNALLMLLYPWETGYAAEDVTGVSKTDTVLTVTLSRSAPAEDVYAGLRQALFVEVNKADVEGCDRFVFEVQASAFSDAETLQTVRYQVRSVEVRTDNTAANRILTGVTDVADLKSRLPDTAAREMLDRYDEAYFENYDLITLYLRQPYHDRILNIVGVTALKNDAGNALDILLGKQAVDSVEAEGRIYCLELPKGIVSAETVLYVYDAYQGWITILADVDGDDMTALELVQGDYYTGLNMEGESLIDLSNQPMMYGGITLWPVDADGDGIKDLSVALDWVQPKGTFELLIQLQDGRWKITSHTWPFPIEVPEIGGAGS